MSGAPRLMVELLYGSGLRLQECLNLRVKDIDFALKTSTVRQGKGDKDRATLLPASPAFCRKAMTSTPSRSCSVTRMSLPRKFTSKCSAAVPRG
jgi:site-specific recombinase XerD